MLAEDLRARRRRLHRARQAAALAAAVPAWWEVEVEARQVRLRKLRHGRRLQESRMVRPSLNAAEAGPITRRTR
jgi:hypothetical protein